MNNKVITIVERIKWHTKSLTEQEKGMLRDELLSMILFNTANESNNENTLNANAFSGLSESEKTLIKKLAAQTETLYRIKRDDESQTS
jgi:hypothetical protein